MILLRPTEVVDLVVVGRGGRCNVMVGALYASQIHCGARVAGLALVFQAVGGRLGPSLARSPTMRLVVDGETLIQELISESGVYHREPGPAGPIETLLILIPPFRLRALAAGRSVDVRLGASLVFRLGPGHLDAFKDLLSQIPADADFGQTHESTFPPLHKSQ